MAKKELEEFERAYEEWEERNMASINEWVKYTLGCGTYIGLAYNLTNCALSRF